AAVDAGALLLQPVGGTALRRKGDIHLCALDDGRELESRTVIAASGSWNPKGVFAVRGRASTASDLFAFQAHFKGAELARGLTPWLPFPGGYGGLGETDAGRVSLSCCIRRDALADARARYGGKAGESVLAHILETTKGAWLALNQAVVEGSFLSTGPIQPGI